MAEAALILRDERATAWEATLDAQSAALALARDELAAHAVATAEAEAALTAREVAAEARCAEAALLEAEGRERLAAVALAEEGLATRAAAANAALDARAATLVLLAERTDAAVPWAACAAWVRSGSERQADAVLRAERLLAAEITPLKGARAATKATTWQSEFDQCSKLHNAPETDELRTQMETKVSAVRIARREVELDARLQEGPRNATAQDRGGKMCSSGAPSPVRRVAGATSGDGIRGAMHSRGRVRHGRPWHSLAWP